MDQFFDYALLFAYAGVMLLLGLSLGLKEFRDILRQPRAVLVGLVSQMLLLPALAFLMAFLLPLPDHLKIGFILLSACPGGSTSNLASYMLRGNVALSISLTALNSFIVILSVPLVMTLAAMAFEFEKGAISLPFWDTLVKIFLLVILPVSAGLLFRRQWPATAKKLEKIFKFLMPVLLAGSIVGLAFFGNGDGPKIGIDEYLDALPAAILLNVVSMLLGYALGWLSGLSNGDRFTIGIEVGIQNSALAIAIASGPLFLGNDLIAIPAIVYLLFPFFSALVFGYIANRRNLRGLFSSDQSPKA